MKPNAPNLGAVPQAMRNLRQWVGWQFKPSKTGKPQKVPVNPRNGRDAKTDNAATWGTFDKARAAVKRYGLAGIGFVFVAGGGFAGVDFDDCLVGGVLVPAAAETVRALDSYCEVSPSGRGVKVFLRAAKPGWVTKCKALGALGCTQVEVYDSGRFFTVTGRRWPEVGP